MIELFNEDNITFMARCPDNYFDLAIVDPPYGIGENWKKDRKSPFYKHSSSYKNDSIPDEKYFKELFRISKNQIIWGANYFTNHLPQRNSWIVWDKSRDYEKQHLAEGELAWTSFNIPLRIFKNSWNGCATSEIRYGKHPHEKPTQLYRWILTKYANQGDKIFDSHLGSGSIAIACHDLKFDLIACEIDPEYYRDTMKRFLNHTMQKQINYD